MNDGTAEKSSWLMECVLVEDSLSDLVAEIDAIAEKFRESLFEDFGHFAVGEVSQKPACRFESETIGPVG